MTEKSVKTNAMRLLETAGIPYRTAEYEVDENADKYAILGQIARNRHCLVKGNELDSEKAARLLLDDFRGGRLGRITLESAESYI